MKRLLVILHLALAGFSACAGDAQPMASDPIAEKRLIALSEQLRCLVCQNQSIADSHADLATDLKREIRSMIQAGKTDKEIIDFMVARYGDFVLYNPPVKGTTLILWLGPVVLLIVGIGTLVVVLRRRSRRLGEEEPAELTPEEQSRAKDLLDKDR